MHSCMHTYIYTRTLAGAKTHAHMTYTTCMHDPMHTYMQACIPVYTHANMHTLGTYLNACIHTCTHTHADTCMQGSTQAHVHTGTPYMHAYIQAHVHTGTHTYRHTYICARVGA